MFKIICSILALTILTPMVQAGVMDPNAIIVVCRSKAPSEKTYQVFGDLTDQGLTKVTYIEINMWSPEIPPVHLKGQTWTIDPTYRPTPKYRDYNRYDVRKNEPGSYGIQVLMPNRATVYAMAKAKAEKEKRTMVQGEFEAVLRYIDNYGDDVGGQEYLDCGTGWLDFK